MADNNLGLDELAKILNGITRDGAYKLLTYQNGPSLKRARVIAGLIGWSIDRVLTDWEQGVARRKEEKAA